MRIGVLGGNFKLISAALASLGYEAVPVCDDDVVKKSKSVVFSGNLLEDIGTEVYPVKPERIIDNSFRGGSMGKGGKIKYRRT